MANISFPPLDRAALLSALDAWTREEIRAVGAFTAKAAAAHLGSLRGAQRLQHHEIRALIEELGDVVRMSNKNAGYTRSSCATLPVTLATLLAAAERDYLDLAHSPEAGRRATRELAAISPGQLTTIKVGAAAASEMVTGDRRNLAGVGLRHFAWVSGAGEAGRGEWQLVLNLAEWSDRDALAAYERKHGTPVGWDRSANADRRKKQTAGVRLLLDLAATHGLLPRGGDVPDVSVPAAAWEPQIDELYQRVLVAGTASAADHNVKSAIRLLTLYATRQGHEQRDTVPWALVRDAIVADHAAGRLTYDRLTAARYAYNALVAANLITADVWPHREHTRLSAFDHAHMESSADTLDFSAWRLKPTVAHPTPHYPTGLVDGTQGPDGAYGIAGWASWTRLDKSDLAAKGLPPRLWVNPTAGQAIKAAKKPDLFRLSPSTLGSRMRGFAMHAGWLTARHGIDWTTAGLEVLCNPDLVTAHIKERSTNPGTRGSGPDTTMSRIAMDLGVMASPYLEARALQRAAALRADGDDAGADGAEAQSAQFRQWGTALRVLGHENQSEHAAAGGHGTDDDSLTAREIRNVWRAWSADGRSGWRKLRVLRDLLIVEVERVGWRCMRAGGIDTDDAAGVLQAHEERRVSIDTLQAEHDRRVSIEAQIAAIRAGTFQPTLEWASAVRDAAVVTLVQRVPLRPRNLVELELHEWCATRADGMAGAPWEGAIQLRIYRKKMKAARPFEPPVVLREDLDDPDVLASVCHDLWELWFMAGGGREEMLRVPAGCEPLGIEPGGVHASTYVFPAPARKGHTRGQTLEERLKSRRGVQWKRGSYSKQLKSIITRYADELKIDLSTLRSIRGSLSGHIVRHLFGSHHCDEQRWNDAIGLLAASKMLSHASVEITQSRYIGKSESDVSVGRRRGGQGKGSASAHPLTSTSTSLVVAGERSSIEIMATELRELRRMLDEGLITPDEHDAEAADARARHRARSAVAA